MMIMIMIINKVLMIMITTQVTVSLGARALLHCTVVGDSHHTVFKTNHMNLKYEYEYEIIYEYEIYMNIHIFILSRSPVIISIILTVRD